VHAHILDLGTTDLLANGALAGQLADVRRHGGDEDDEGCQSNEDSASEHDGS